MNDAEVGKAVWPTRLSTLCQELQSDSASPNRQELRREIWTILGNALQRYAELQKPRCSDLTTEDVEDLASEKSLEFIRRLESGKWRVDDRSGPEIASFLATAARNAVLDLLRRPHRRCRVGVAALDTPSGHTSAEMRSWSAPDTPLEQQEFITALRECTSLLQPRVRRIWFFRVFYGMASKEIAAHPKVNLKSARVDDLLFELRQAIRACMEAKGQRPRQLPTGTFFEIWKGLRVRTFEEVGVHGHTVGTTV